MAKRSLTREQERAVLDRVYAAKEGNDMFPNGVYYASKGRKGKARSPASSPRRLVASRSSEEEGGRRTGAYVAGDDVSFEDIISYAKYTPEFSETFSNSSKKKFEDIQSPGDFIWWVFNKSGSYKEERDSFQCPEPCHIQSMAYADRWNLLKVRFTNDDTEIVYTRVPANVFEILRGHAERKSRGIGVDGKEHSKVGMAFWDYVRIRGTRQGVQYPAYYLSGAPSANKGLGGKAAAAEGTAVAGTQRTGKDGLSIDAGDKKNAREAAAYRPFAFFGEELTPKMKREIKLAAGPIANREGTIAFKLVHDEMGEAEELAKLFKKKFIDSERTSKSLKDKLNQIANDPRSESYEALLEMEEYMISQGQWPLPQ